MPNAEKSQRIKLLVPGRIDADYGPYASLAAACLAIPNVSTMRANKPVGITINGVTVDYTWHPGNLTDAGLVKVNNDSFPSDTHIVKSKYRQIALQAISNWTWTDGSDVVGVVPIIGGKPIWKTLADGWVSIPITLDVTSKFVGLVFECIALKEIANFNPVNAHLNVNGVVKTLTQVKYEQIGNRFIYTGYYNLSTLLGTDAVTLNLAIHVKNKPATTHIVAELSQANVFYIDDTDVDGIFTVSDELKKLTTELTDFTELTNFSLSKVVKPSVGKNLYNKATNTINAYLNSATGGLIIHAAYQTSDFIEVMGSTLYQVTRASFVMCYDAGLNYIGQIPNGPMTSFTTLANTKFVRFSDQNSFMISGQQLEAGSVKTTVENYKYKFDESLIPTTDFSSLGYVKPTVGKNLYNKATNTLNAYHDYLGNVVVHSGYQISDFIEVTGSTLYQITRASFVMCYDTNKVFINQIPGGPMTSFTTLANAKFIRISDINSIMNSGQQVEAGNAPTTFEEYGIKFSKSVIPSSIPELITKTVKRNGTVGVDCDFTGRRAIQDCADSILDASELKQYIIRASGIFEATQASHFDRGTSGSLAFILLKPYVHLIGRSKDDCIIAGYLPNNLTTSFAYQNYQTIHHNINNSRIENVTVTGQNLRYPLHIDGGKSGCKDYIQTLKSVKIWHKNNTGDALTVWPSTTSFGLGTSDGQVITLEDCEIKGPRGGYIHNNESFQSPSILKYIRTKINHDGDVLRVQSLGSNVRDKFILEDCVLDFGSIRYDNSPWIPTELINQRADHAEIEVIINGNPIAFDNSALTGKGLRIKSKTTGSGSSVTFDSASTAFNLIIGNSLESTEIVNRYNRQQIYGYQFKAGGQGLSGYAIGSLDIGQYLVGILSNKYIGALGKRLGDCSTVNKTLTVIINGTSYNIVFNKNYNGTAETVAPTYSNAQIIAEITAVLGAVADVDEYVVGKDYFPQFDNVKTMVNADITEVLSGMGVVFTDRKTFRKALNADGRIDGICLDDGRVGDECRIITAGEIYSFYSNQRFSTFENTSTTLAINTQLGISATVAGKFDSAASPKVLRAIRANVLTFIK